MKRVLAVFFTAAVLGVGLPAGSAVASPDVFGVTNGVCANNPGQGTQNLNNGNHSGVPNHCVAI
jgi:hypothetical protein